MVGIPEHLHEEYREIMRNVRQSILVFSKRKWDDGYVGICDCDIAVCIGAEGHLYAKILEYNYNRETGGTASYHLWQRLGNGNGVVIARDTIEGPGFAYPIPQLRNMMNGTLLRHGTSGAVILGHRMDVQQNKGKIMSLVYGESFADASY
jgi:hypothetical protein